jgi:DNA modification methylase
MLNALKADAFFPLPNNDVTTEARDALYNKFRNRIVHNPALDRTIVSFQANKRIPFYSWFKYKEGFSQRLVSYLLEHLWQKSPGVLLDPFAGAGAALFASKELGWKTAGIEVLPVGIFVMKARMAASRINALSFEKEISKIIGLDFQAYYDKEYEIKHIAITSGAFHIDDEKQLVGYLSYCNNHVTDKDILTLLEFAAFSVLEEISYTRKDGQYLRWDYRSGRSQGKEPFDKGKIKRFGKAIEEKLLTILTDINTDNHQEVLPLFSNNNHFIEIDPEISEGSCLDLLPQYEKNSIDFVLTSPPYANRYDYTRTYALELVFLGNNQESVKNYRQKMLSCTVENKDKRNHLQKYYENLGKRESFDFIDKVFHNQKALQEILNILNEYRKEGKLNNSNVARLVHNYFYEMCFVIFELSRITRKGGIVAMVNDNVRYAGEEVPVDLILSDMAESFGLVTRFIWTLGKGKGNSSQQMGTHGRSELRKCVYIWEKEN